MTPYQTLLKLFELVTRSELIRDQITRRIADVSKHLDEFVRMLYLQDVKQIQSSAKKLYLPLNLRLSEEGNKDYFSNELAEFVRSTLPSLFNSEANRDFVTSFANRFNQELSKEYITEYMSNNDPDDADDIINFIKAEAAKMRNGTELIPDNIGGMTLRVAGIFAPLYTYALLGVSSTSVLDSQESAIK